MIDLNVYLCKIEGCPTKPSFAKPGFKASRCAAHAQRGMVDVVSKRCDAPGCTTRPVYSPAVVGERATKCAAHAPPLWRDVKHRKCDSPAPNLCDRIPNFGFPGAGARRCAGHMEQGMVNVVSPRCDAPGCTKIPSFGPAVGDRATKCATHAPPHWRDVVNRKCDSPAPNLCDKHPSFGFPGAGARRCFGHAEQGMVDVRSKQCAAPGCGKHPTYGPPGGPRKYCAGHAGPGDVNLASKKKTAPKVTVK